MRGWMALVATAILCATARAVDDGLKRYVSRDYDDGSNVFFGLDDRIKGRSAIGAIFSESDKFTIWNKGYRKRWSPRTGLTSYRANLSTVSRRQGVNNDRLRFVFRGEVLLSFEAHNRFTGWFDETPYCTTLIVAR